MGLPALTIGMVIAQDPENGGLRVLLRSSGQGPAYFVTMGYDGPADALNIRQRSLPRTGTWGLIAFPYEDSRNGIWLLSILPSQLDALTASIEGTGPLPVTDSYWEYFAHFSGLYQQLDFQGNQYTQFPDGSIFAVASGVVTTSGDVPVPYRHILEGGVRTRTAFPMSARVPNPPTPYSWSGVHPSGTFAYVDGSGSVSGYVVSGFSLAVSGNGTIYVSGSTTLNVQGTTTLNSSGALAVNSSGAVTVNASGSVVVNVASGQTLQFNCNGTQITVDTSGNVIFALNGGSSVQIGGNGDALTLVSKMVTAFNNHAHTLVGFQAGGTSKATSSPNSAISAADISSVVAKAGS